MFAACAVAGGGAFAQRTVAERPQPQFRALEPAGETESATNTLTFLLREGYQIVGVTERDLVLHKGERVYFCPFARYRDGTGGAERILLQGACSHLRDPLAEQP